ncbi:hypothetical protein [Actinopolymorpha alba]|uniref:hypothetical protein n=1 Tax=Actinopolymorpha alba TaxID=533267 RepID=UPI00039A7C4B|nr:hypothetical protein [Actinopolymorpha alba]
MSRETLTDLLRLASQRHDASGRRLGDIAASNGWDITHTTINHILAGRYRSRPGPRTLEAIANLANVSLERVYAAADVPLPARRLADELPREADLLTPRQRTAVIEVIRAMVDAHGAAGESDTADPAAAEEAMSRPQPLAPIEVRRAALNELRDRIKTNPGLTEEQRVMWAEQIAGLERQLEDEHPSDRDAL